jgi:hypothetical protein
LSRVLDEKIKYFFVMLQKG